MKLYYIPFLILPLALAACSDTTNKDKYGGYGEMTEESLSGASYDNNSYLLAPAPKYHVGSAYKVDDIQYTPMEDMSYNQTGIAGIIPNDLNGTKTTNGEVFNSEQLVATSKVLPLPSIVRVTNLDNGNSAVLRVNNRGPFVNSRIMDVSTAAAKKLGMTGQTKVQVQVLAEQSLAVKNATLGVGGMTAEEPEYRPAPQPQPAATGGTGPYTVQVAAFYSEDSAQALARRISNLGNVRVDNEGGMHKVRVVGLDAPTARRTIDTLRHNEAMSPGLLKDGRWINADSI
ncbi:MAG: septal ring lytic transglycosylase RlpA family protein [Alphaproteobacteria bacterium]|nr:septal ring lytic transglycosylase RlpA family protein [Alphaproteobacteria bacterium]